jgi:hypothetical protein
MKNGLLIRRWSRLLQYVVNLCSDTPSIFHQRKPIPSVLTSTAWATQGLGFAFHQIRLALRCVRVEVNG